MNFGVVGELRRWTLFCLRFASERPCKIHILQAPTAMTLQSRIGRDEI